MLRTTNKTVDQTLRIQVLEYFAETAGYERDNGNPTATPISCLVSQIDYMRYGNRSIYQTALDWVEGGSALVYYDEQREFLRNLLNQTESEALQFSDDKVFKLYCHLMARTMAKLYTEGK
jgi:hypothetical protein